MKAKAKKKGGNKKRPTFKELYRRGDRIVYLPYEVSNFWDERIEPGKVTMVSQMWLTVKLDRDTNLNGGDPTLSPGRQLRFHQVLPWEYFVLIRSTHNKPCQDCEKRENEKEKSEREMASKRANRLLDILLNGMEKACGE